MVAARLLELEVGCSTAGWSHAHTCNMRQQVGIQSWLAACHCIADVKAANLQIACHDLLVPLGMNTRL